MMQNQTIKKEDLVVRSIYQIHSRNLAIGVYDGDRGFIGIRTKFGSQYLFKEFYADGGPFGTVLPKKVLGTLPDSIELRTHGPDFDSRTLRPVGFDKPISEGGRGWYFVDTGEFSNEIRPVCETYEPLFEFLKNIESTL